MSGTHFVCVNSSVAELEMVRSFSAVFLNSTPSENVHQTPIGLKFCASVRESTVKALERASAMSLADSEAAFQLHCSKVSPDGFLFGLLSNHRITNLSALAFAVGTPQSPPSEAQFKEFATGINNDTDMTFGELSMLRRLHFEASAIVMAELKSRATDTTGDGSRKLPTAEKSARLLDQEKRLPGLRIRGEL